MNIDELVAFLEEAQEHQVDTRLLCNVNSGRCMVFDMSLGYDEENSLDEYFQKDDWMEVEVGSFSHEMFHAFFDRLEPSLRQRLYHNLHTRGGYRKVKDILFYEGKTDAFHTHCDQYKKAIAINWCKDHGIPHESKKY